MNIYGILSTKPYLIVPLTKWNSINIYQNFILKVNFETIFISKFLYL